MHLKLYVRRTGSARFKCRNRVCVCVCKWEVVDVTGQIGSVNGLLSLCQLGWFFFGHAGTALKIDVAFIMQMRWLLTIQYE